MTINSFGAFGSLFVDASSSGTIFHDPSFLFPEISYVEAIDPSPLIDGAYVIATATGTLPPAFVGLSSLTSGNLKQNLQFTIPAISSEARAKLEAKVESNRRMKPEQKESARSVIKSYFKEDLEDCPFAGLSFPVLGITRGRDYILGDPHGVLAKHFNKVKRLFYIPSTLTATYRPLSSYEWLQCDMDANSLQSLLESEIDCYLPEMSSSLSTYSAFLRAQHQSSYDHTRLTHISASTSGSPSHCDPTTLLWNRLRSSSSKRFMPTITFIASSAVSEVVKIVSGTGKPMTKWRFFDAPELFQFWKPPTDEIDANSVSLLFPPSQYPALAHASILVLENIQSTLEMSQNLALSGVCSDGGKVTVLKSDYDLDMNLASSVWRSDRTIELTTELNDTSTLRCPKVSLRTTLLPKLRPGYSDVYARISDWQSDLAVCERLESDEEVLLHSATHYTPILVLQPQCTTSSVEHIIPCATTSELSYSWKPAWINYTSCSSPVSLEKLIEDAKVLLDTFLVASTSVHLAIEEILRGEEPARFMNSHLIEWQKQQCKTLEVCVQLAVNFYSKQFHYKPRTELEKTLLVRFPDGDDVDDSDDDIDGNEDNNDDNGEDENDDSDDQDEDSDSDDFDCVIGLPAWTTAPRALKDSLLADHDMYAINFVVLIAISAAIQNRVLPSPPSPSSFGLDLDHYYHSLRDTIVKTIATTKPSPYESTDDATTEVVDKSVFGPDFNIETDGPKRLGYYMSLSPTCTTAEMDLLCAAANLLSRVYGMGEIPLSTVMSVWKTRVLPTSVVQTSSLAALEAMKMLFLVEKSQSLPFDWESLDTTCLREHYINIRADHYLTLPTKPLTDDEPPRIHLYVSRSFTVSELILYLRENYDMALVSVSSPKGPVKYWQSGQSRIANERSAIDVPLLLLAQYYSTYIFVPDMTFSLLDLEIRAHHVNGQRIKFPTVTLHFTN